MLAWPYSLNLVWSECIQIIGSEFFEEAVNSYCCVKLILTLVLRIMASYIQRFKSVWLLFVENAECWRLMFMWTYHIVFKNRKITSKEQLLIYKDKSSIMSWEIFSKVVRPVIEGGGWQKTLLWNKVRWTTRDKLLFHSW